jgi:tRNA(Glu) U13 pseudouridine synthase TruD
MCVISVCVCTDFFDAALCLYRFGAELGLSLSSDVGRQLVKGRWSSALLALLDIDPGETDPDVVAARACFDGRPELLQDDVAAALDRMPARRPKEKALLRALTRHGVGPVGCEKALMALPQPGRQFDVHAYASLVFNKMATARMQHSGVLPGDLVANPNDGEAVKVLSAEEAVSGVYTLADVLLPIPGCVTPYCLSP